MARKWRPKKFAEMIGQDHVATTIENAIKSDRIHHAYLFTGTRGVGKTTSARILAKTLNCTEGETWIPCDQCNSCNSITKGSSLDVLEVDGASNNSVENVRSLIDQVQYAPMHGKYRIIIIDEVHMLTKSAFNALLKTLEDSNDIDEWQSKLKNEIQSVTQDDATMSLLSIGWNEFSSLKKDFNGKAEQLYDQFIAPNEASRNEIDRIKSELEKKQSDYKAEFQKGTSEYIKNRIKS